MSDSMYLSLSNQIRIIILLVLIVNEHSTHMCVCKTKNYLQVNIYMYVSLSLSLSLSLYLARPSVTLSSNCNCLNNREIVVAINTTFSITCNDSNGDPPPTFTWLKDNIELNNNSVIIQQLSNRVSRLTINDIQAKQAGRYTCRVNNVVGKNHQDVTINIAGKAINMLFKFCALSL